MWRLVDQHDDAVHGVQFGRNEVEVSDTSSEPLRVHPGLVTRPARRCGLGGARRRWPVIGLPAAPGVWWRWLGLGRAGRWRYATCGRWRNHRLLGRRCQCLVGTWQLLSRGGAECWKQLKRNRRQAEPPSGMSGGVLWLWLHQQRPQQHHQAAHPCCPGSRRYWYATMRGYPPTSQRQRGVGSASIGVVVRNLRGAR